MVGRNLNTKQNNGKVQLSFSIFGVLFAITLIAGAFAVSVSTKATDTSKVDSVNVSITAACTMTETSSTNGVYNASLIPGQSIELGPTSIKTTCNDNGGFAIYGIGFSGDSYSAATHTDLISSINTDYNIHTNTPGSAGSNSYWAMKLAAVPSGAYTPTIEGGYANYNVVPSSFTKVASLNQATDMGESATGSNINITYEVKASNGQVAGSYQGKVKYVLVHPNGFAPGTYSIAYNANGGSGTMTGESGLDNYTPHTLKANTFTAPSGYRFAGWCTTNTSQNACTDGDLYTDEATIEPSTITANTALNLYAIWEVIPYIQDFTAAQCQAKALNTPFTVIDRRDGSDYTVRYINGNCWMTQNLRITGVVSAADSNFEGADFNISAGDLKGNYMTYSAARSHRADSADVASAPSGYTIDILGAWYNYCAASAGQVCSQTRVDATQDICPAGWHLPSHSQNGGITSYASSFLPVYGGYYYDGWLRSAASYGYWWSATASSTSNQYYLMRFSVFLDTGNEDKINGYYIRCLRST
ncbi:MAG: fibrobacter succinogenes major paralogous domain-containing protein [Candidatus Saccharibacteria bacterium]|nr:fibrobacter succinogenes major paralogous domain-containing protein [Candidatus Saccharibacteria bacterium]